MERTIALEAPLCKLSGPKSMHHMQRTAQPGKPLCALQAWIHRMANMSSADTRQRGSDQRQRVRRTAGAGGDRGGRTGRLSGRPLRFIVHSLLNST